MRDWFKRHPDYNRKWREKHPGVSQRACKNWRKKNPDYYIEYDLDPENHHRKLARLKLNAAVRYGKVEKLPCKMCGNTKVEGHHEDYDQPLQVVWLCKKDHEEFHRLKIVA